MIAPIQVRCSKSSLQIVRVKNGQGINVLVTDASVVQIHTEFLCLTNVRNFVDGAAIYEISQVQSENLNMNSMFLLGEISVGVKTLLIYLESDLIEKSNYLTVLDPTFDTVLLKPYQTLEIVISDEIYPITSWDWEWVLFDNVEIDNITSRCIRMIHHHWAEGNLIEPFSIAPKIPITQQNLQRHYWFRFNKSIIELLKHDSIERRVPVGRLTFIGTIGKKISSERIIDIFVDLKKKHFVQTSDILQKQLSYNTHDDKSIRVMQVSEVDFQLLICNSIEQGCNVIEWDKNYEFPIQK